ncbi:MAG: 6,7-dimethyl-8-ribityllumazine synthase [Candidatus Sulfotelmatobacter sp.]
MIKSIQLTALTKSLADFRALIKLLDSLGVHKEIRGSNENYHYADYWPRDMSLQVMYGTRQDNADLGLIVTDPDSAFEVVKKLGFKLLGEFSRPNMGDHFRFFDVELPSGARVRIGGSRADVVRDSDLVTQLQGGLNASGKRFCLVVSTFNSFITERLLAGAVDVLIRSDAALRTIVRVPGAFEIPSAARTVAKTNCYDAIICIGCLLRGDTAHYDVIVNEVARGIGQSAQETGVPHAFGVLTCDTLEQAIDRAGLKMGNKGVEAALAAIEMANLTKAVSGLSSEATGKKPARGRSLSRPKR